MSCGHIIMYSKSPWVKSVFYLKDSCQQPAIFKEISLFISK